MLKSLTIMEDAVIEWEIIDSLSSTLKVTDTASGESGETNLSTEDLAVIMYLMIGSDNAKHAEDLYPAAERVMARLPDSCRCIP